MSELLDHLQTMTFHDWLLIAYGAAIVGGSIWMVLTWRRSK